MLPPKVVPEPGWREFQLPFSIGSGRSMFVETPEGPTIRMRFFERQSDAAVVGRVWFGGSTFGPPGFVHGGLVAYVLDEAMGSCAWLRGYPCVAANLNLDYIQMTPIGEDCFIEARITELQPRKVIVETELKLNDKTLVRGRGFFVRVKKDNLVAYAQRANVELPDLSHFQFAE